MPGTTVDYLKVQSSSANDSLTAHRMGNDLRKDGRAIASDRVKCSVERHSDPQVRPS
jgi:hypothetical protein